MTNFPPDSDSGAQTERQALAQHDPILAKLLLKIWGTPKAYRDPPPP